MTNYEFIICHFISHSEKDQSSVLGADILNNPRNNYYGRSSNYPQRIQLSPKHQSGEFQCSWEVKLCNSIILVVHVCKQWPIRRRSDYIIGFITPAIGPNKSKKLTRPIVPTHNLRGKVLMEDSTHGFTDNCCL